MSVYSPRPIKRVRRTKAEIEAIDDQLYEIIGQQKPMTCRQAFYQASSKGIIDKTEAAYKGTVIRRLSIMRREGRLPWDWIADNTRWMRKPRTWGGMQSAIERTAETYRRQMWDNQDAYVEIWMEKDALAGVVYDVTDGFDVPLMVSRGFSSITFLYTAAEAIAAQDKPAYIYLFSDHDPSGVSLAKSIEKSLREFAPDAEIHFERVAVTEQQIEEMKLPTRPTKKTDSRAKTFKGESVDLDAIPPDKLRDLVEDCILRHIDVHAWEAMRKIEQEERNAMMYLAQQWEGYRP